MLTDEQLRSFAVDGYLVVPGVVPEDLLAAADEEIDAFLPTRPPNMDGGDAPDGSAPGRHGWSYDADLLPRCEDALRLSGALTVAEELVAPHTLDHQYGHTQIATTVPPYDHVPGGSHIDGHGFSGEAPGTFTMLAGIALTDQTVPQSGNLWVWAGSHLGHSAIFHERGTHALTRAGGHTVYLDPPQQPGVQREVFAARGDLLLAHFLLGHNGGGNQQPWVRRTIYYRLAVPGHAERWEQTFLDPWTEYAPIRQVA